jgi:acyl carrier protein
MTTTPSARLDAEIEAFVLEILATRFDVPAEQLSPASDLLELGIDSLGAIEVGLELKSRYGVDFTAGDIPVEFTVAAIVDMARRKLGAPRAAAS